MDNSHLAHPSPEWIAYGASNPHLRINDISDPGFPTPAALREAANAAKVSKVRAQLAESGLDKTVSRTDYAALARDGAEIPLRAYRSRRGETRSTLPATFIYFHGGGMLLGTLDTEDFNCSAWADLLGSDVLIVSVNYRHTPEFVFPTQQHDAWDAFEWICDHAATLEFDTARVVVGGISSGGNLSAGVVLEELKRKRKEGDPGRILGQLLAMPWLVHRDAYPAGEKASSSLAQCRGAPVMPGDTYDLFTNLLGEGSEEGFSVGLADAESLEGAPPTAIVACGWDILRDEASAFAQRLESVGTPVKKHVFPGLPHAFTKYPGLPSSKRFNDLMAESIRWCLSGPQADDNGEWTLEIPEEHLIEVKQCQPVKKPCYSWVPSLGGKLLGCL